MDGSRDHLSRGNNQEQKINATPYTKYEKLILEFDENGGFQSLRTVKGDGERERLNNLFSYS